MTPQVRRTTTVQDKLYFGDKAGNSLLLFGEDYQDEGTRIDALAEYNTVAPAGAGGECLFRNFYVTVTALTAASITVTPKVDGKAYEAITITPDGNEPYTERFEIPITQDYDPGAGAVSRAGVRGTWCTAEISAFDSEGTGWDVEIEGCELEYELLREVLPARGFTVENLVVTSRPKLEELFWGEKGDGIWVESATPGPAPCPEISADGVICKEHNGLIALVDWRTEAFDSGVWKQLHGVAPTIVAGEYVEFLGHGALIWDYAAAERNTLWVQFEHFYVHFQGWTPVLGTNGKLSDAEYEYGRVMNVVNDDRTTVGHRLGGMSDQATGVIDNTKQGRWNWMKVFSRPRGAPDNDIWVEEGCIDGSFSRQFFDTAHYPRSGKPVIGAARILSLDPQDTPARMRQVRACESDTVILKNLPDGLQVHFIRDAGEHVFRQQIFQNVSGSPATMTWVNAGWFFPFTRIEVREVALPNALIAQMTPFDGINGGDIYCYQCGPFPQIVLEPNPIAPAGRGGECLFKNVYVAVTHNNASDVRFNFLPFIDDNPLAVQILTVPGVAGPVTEVIELPLPQAYDDGSGDVSQYGARGAWFTFRISSAFPVETEIFFETAEIEFDVVRESLAASQ